MEEVREGLICPICMQDLGTIEELTSHFKLAHPEPEANEALASLKDIFSKAKKKLLNEDSPPRSGVVNGRDRMDREGTPAFPQSFSYSYLDMPEQSEPGYIVNHSDAFRKSRSNRVQRYDAQINKLVVRLSKLLAPGTPIGNDKKRREFEQLTVQWVDEQLVPRCPNCAELFNAFLGRRKHHCRLCGAITCQDCSRFVDNPLAQKLLQGQIGTSIPVLELRCCSDCFELLLRKKLMLSQENIKDPLHEAYVKMRELMDRSVVLKGQYIAAMDALMAGESSLAIAQELRASVIKLAEKAETIAKRIGESAKDPNLPARQAQLRILIRNITVQYVKELVFTMPQLPEAEELDRVALQRREEARRRVERPSAVSVVPTTVVAGGWSPQVASGQSDPFNGGKDELDPLLEQISNIKRYLAKAREDGRTDEVYLLAENLRQLEVAAGLRS
ncbi:rabenosyn-5-like [Varroa jacobsoni]|uniref:FYVE-type domain-containing protein n=1 Tax=Varroa destructor TaxID=109461 RepID=A0A7M7JHN4_VARDE|nr:rabenosyn-5-like [Varroa destructor]XP_022705290.1 rabenosyn-5-like [Varroa jacobsoni]